MEEDSLQVTYYDWHQIHDKWLNDIMKDKLGVMEGLGRMDFPSIHTTARLLQVWKIHLTPTRAFWVKYDICIKVQESTDLVAEARLRFMELLTKIQEVDRHPIVYPWLDPDQWSSQRTSHRQSWGNTYSIIEYGKAHLLDANMPEWQTGLPTCLLWLHGTTRQDHEEHWMVVTIYRTRHVESTASTGRRNLRTWMATFLADKFDKEALKSQIWETTGVHVALRYQAIDDGIIKWDAANKKRVKVLHIEVDKADSVSSRNRIECLYSLAATVFLCESRWGW